MASQVLFQDIANYLSESPEWVENWLNTPVKYKPNPLMLPELVQVFFRNIPTEAFDKSLKINRDWYRECKYILCKRRAFYVDRYWETIKEYKKASKALDKCWENGIISPSDPHYSQCRDKYNELVNTKEEDFEAWVNIDRACLRCGFRDLIDHINPNYYISMYECGMDPYEIPTPGNDPEGILDPESILDYWSDEDSDA